MFLFCPPTNTNLEHNNNNNNYINVNLTMRTWNVMKNTWGKNIQKTEVSELPIFLFKILVYIWPKYQFLVS